MKKQQEIDGSNALNFVDSLESTQKHLESWCEEQVRRYSGESWPIGFAAAQMRSSVLSYINAAEHRVIRTKDNAENYAWRVAMAKFAERLADRYGIELN